MRVEIKWSKTHDYGTVIEVDDAEYTDWLDGSPSDNVALAEFLQAHRDAPENWLPQIFEIVGTG